MSTAIQIRKTGSKHHSFVTKIDKRHSSVVDSVAWTSNDIHIDMDSMSRRDSRSTSNRQYVAVDGSFLAAFVRFSHLRRPSTCKAELLLCRVIAMAICTLYVPTPVHWFAISSILGRSASGTREAEF